MMSAPVFEHRQPEDERVDWGEERESDAEAVDGGPRYAANRALPLPDDPVAALWQSRTTLREQRGDAHGTDAGRVLLDGVEAETDAAATESFAAPTGASPSLD